MIKALHYNPGCRQFGSAKVPYSQSFFSSFFSLSLLNYTNGRCWIVVYIMFVTKSVGIGMANIIITPEKHFMRKHCT